MIWRIRMRRTIRHLEVWTGPTPSVQLSGSFRWWGPFLALACAVPLLLTRSTVGWLIAGVLIILFLGVGGSALFWWHRGLICKAMAHLVAEPSARHRVWWASIVDHDLLELCYLVNWWTTSMPLDPRTIPGPLSYPVTTSLRQALGLPNSTNLDPSAANLLSIVPKLDLHDPLTDTLCNLAWTGYSNDAVSSWTRGLQITAVGAKAEAERAYALEVLEAVAATRALYRNVDEENAAITLSEVMLPAVAEGEVRPRPMEILLDLQRCVHTLLASDVGAVGALS